MMRIFKRSEPEPRSGSVVKITASDSAHDGDLGVVRDQVGKQYRVQSGALTDRLDRNGFKVIKR